MAISVRAESDPERPLGHARIVVSGLASMPAETGFVIRREGYERANLGPRGWQVSEAQLKPLAARQSGDAVVLSVGPDLVRHMEAGPAIFAWPAARIETALFWPDDIDVFDGELPRDEPEPPPAPAPRAASAPQPAPADAAPAPTPPIRPEPQSPPQQPKAPEPRKADGGGNRAVLAIFALLAVAAAAASGWYYLYGPGAKPPQTAQAPSPSTQQPTPQPLPPPQPAVTWPEGTDSLSLQELVAKAPNVEGIFTAALRRQAAGRHDDALVLLEEAGEKGHAPALTALARLYDPVGFEPGKPFRSPDPRAAARYYREAVRKGDSGAAERRAALKTFLEGQAATNPSAADALKEFWP